mgnify:FL=1|jgi:cytochrome c-type biogenesis protein CcmE
MTRKQRRMTILGVGLACLAVATALVLTALSDKVTFFYSPSDLAADEAGHNARIRLGGMVEEGSVVKEGDGITTAFVITDFVEAVPVRYTGVLPDLFREGQGIIATGSMDGGTFIAEEVLAKHDETYMPPEVADALKAAGKWQMGDQP